MMAAKAYQAGVIREQLFKQRDTATPYGIDSDNLVQSFANLNNKLAGLPATNGIVNGTQAFLVPTVPVGALKSKMLASLQILGCACPQLCLTAFQLRCVLSNVEASQKLGRVFGLHPFGALGRGTPVNLLF